MRIRQVTILCILFALVLALAAGSAMAQAGAKPAPAAKTAAGDPPRAWSRSRPGP